MDTAPLKKFAPAARTLLIEQVSARLTRVLAGDSLARRESAPTVKALEQAIAATSRGQVVEQVAYTWFNRFTALRFMDAGGYTIPRIVSPAPGQTVPEILAQAKAGAVDVPAPVTALLDGTTPSRDAEGEAYRLLLVAECERWRAAMPYLFGRIDDYAALLMPGDLLSPDSILARLRAVMTDEACADVEIIGWLYQFYIAERKDEVFGRPSGAKIEAKDIPAATQLFTPHWIVRYLVENSLGRLWLLNRPASGLAARMDYYIAPEEPETDFLRIDRPEDVRLCDPAAGSGHMLTYAFDLLYAIYEEEGYAPADIPALILTHNLTGIEIDERAGSLAAFALAMKAAARLGRRRFLRMAARPGIVVLEDVAFTEAEMRDVAAMVGGDLFTDALRETLGQFGQAKNFGSLIVPALTDPAETLRAVEARDFGSDLLLRDVQARVVTVLRMAEALAPTYHVVVANPPYAGAKGLNENLRSFSNKIYPDSKSDLYSMFIERCSILTFAGGSYAMVTMHGWMFLSSFKSLRKKILKKAPVISMAHMGRASFDGLSVELVTTTAFVGSAGRNPETPQTYIRSVHGFGEAEKSAITLQAIEDPNSKFRFKRNSSDFLQIQSFPFAYWASEEVLKAFGTLPAIGDKFQVRQGLATADDDKFLRDWYEISLCHSTIKIDERSRRWHPFTKGGFGRKWYGNNFLLVDWENNGRRLKDFERSYVRNEHTYFLPHITWSLINGGAPSFRYGGEGFVFGHKGPVVVSPDSPDQLASTILLLNSNVAERLLQVTSPSLAIEIGHLASLPISETKLDNSTFFSLKTIARSDWDAYETSWDFTTLPLLSPDHRGETLDGTYAALRKHWQGMTDEMQRLEEENNRIFIDAYGLADELTPDVPLAEITLTCNPAYSIGGDKTDAQREDELRARTMREFLSYAVGCMTGRYSLDAPGLILADAGGTLADYLARLRAEGVPGPTYPPDADNVIPVLDGDWFADDITERFRAFLRATFGEAHFRDNLAFIEGALGKDIRRYFVRDFYRDHWQRYKKRPIYWMVSSPKGSFQALIAMHRYRPDTLSVLLNGYLREYQRKLDAHHARLIEQADDADTAQGARTKAMKEAEKVARQIAELREWERDVIHPLAERRIEIDLDDGVKANYPTFAGALKAIPGL